MCEAPTALLEDTLSTYDVLIGLLSTSKQLITALEKADWLDRLLIFAAPHVLCGCDTLHSETPPRSWAAYCLLVGALLVSIDQGNSCLVANDVVMEKAATPTDSFATIASFVVTP